MIRSDISPSIRVVELRPLYIHTKVVQRVPVQILRQSNVVSTSTVNRSNVRSMQNLLLDNSVEYSSINDQEKKIRELQVDLANWKHRYSTLDIQYNELLLGQYQGGDDSRHEVILRENSRVNMMLKEKIQELEQLRVGTVELEMEVYRLKVIERDQDKLHQLIQIKQNECEEWRQRCFDQELQLSSLRQIELKMQEQQSKVNLLQQEVDGWKKRYHSSEKNKNESMEDLRQTYETHQSQYDSLRKGVDSQRSNQDVEMRRLKDHVEQQTMELDRLSQINSKQAVTMNDLMRNIKEYENKILYQVDEISRLTISVQQRTLNGSDTSRQSQSGRDNIQQEILNYQQMIEQYKTENEEFKDYFSKMQIHKDEWQYQVKHDLITCQAQNRELQEQNKMLNSQLRMKDIELKGWMTTVHNSQLLDQCETLELRFTTNMNTSEQNSQNNQLKLQLGQVREDKDATICQLEDKLAMLSGELLRLQKSNNDKSTRITSYELEMKNIQDLFQQKLLQQDNIKIQQYDADFRSDQLNEQIQELQSLLRIKTSEMEEVVKRNKIIQSDVTQIRLRHDEKQYHLEQVLQQLGQLQDENDILQKEICRLEKLLSEANEELYLFKFQYASQSSLSHKIQELLTILVLNFVEIESLRSRVLSKDELIEDLRKSNLAFYKK